MLQPDTLLRSIQGSLSPGLAAVHVIGEFRCELDQMISLLEAAMAEGEHAPLPQCPERHRAMNIARALRDIMAADARQLGELEVMVTALPIAPVIDVDALEST